jgi:hypothetical protein
MNQFKEMWIPCDESQYSEVKALLEGMGFTLWGSQMFTLDIGILTYADGDYQITSVGCKERPTVTFDELRAMAGVNTKPDDLAALETLFLNFIEAVAEMREAQRKYEKAPRSNRPEALGIRLKHERQVDAMINDVTRKP